MAEHDALIGWWKLVSHQFEFADTGACVDVFGADPQGYLIISGEGRMMAIVTSDGRAPLADAGDSAALFQSMVAYTGAIRLGDGDKFVTTVEVAWHPAWIGTEQVRFCRVEGDVLSMSTPQQTHPKYPGRTGRALLSWRRP